MTIDERYGKILEWFRLNRPDAASELHFESPYQLLVAVMLSAQCTDRRVNMVTPGLFRAFPTPQALSEASVEQVYSLISSVSYPNAKAQHLTAMAARLVSDFGGEVPQTVEQLQTLPGVGRKTANVVASICFGAPVIAVDTHVFRVARRIGLSKGAGVNDVEEDLTRHIPAEIRAKAHHWIILHGRYICTARHPFCEECGLKEWCRGYEKNNPDFLK
ncbi:MAG: endonuclease III [Bacteroidales bacterium]|nr:endonuclease III [Candidatus Hennigimonas equi]